MIELLYIAGVFFLFIFLQSIFVAGAYGAAQGETRIRPDGTEEDGEQILYPIRKWLEQTETVRVDYTDPEQFDILYDALKRKFGPAFPSHIKYPTSITFFDMEVDGQSVNKFVKIVQQDGGVHVDVERSGMGFVVKFFVLEDRYVFSKYIRKPTLGCPKCMPSLWGLFTYWVPVLWIFGFQWWELLVYIPNVVCCSYLSYLFYKGVE